MLLYLVLFLTTFCCICFSQSDDQILVNRYVNCTKDYPLDGVNIYYFYSTFKNNPMLTTFESFKKDAILTCLCRETYDPIFFISPSFVNESFEDIYFLCVLGNPESSGMYDDYEIYDMLLFEHVKTIPNTLMTPFLDTKNNVLKDDDVCLDQDGFPTKSIANQRTCFFAVKRNDTGTTEILSGPLISSELPNIEPRVLTSNPFCYTSVKNTTFKTDDYCFYSPYNSLFFCCCAKEPKNCRNEKDSKEKQKKLFCAPSGFKNFDSDIDLPMQTYLNESVNYMCGINVSTVLKALSTNTNDKVKYEYEQFFDVKYFSINSCSTEAPIIDISKSKFCALEPVKPKKIKIQRCCKNGHFCNVDLTPAKKPIKNRCTYKPDISLYFDESNICEIYHNITDGERVYLHENFTTKIIHRTKVDYVQNGWEHFLDRAQYLCYYIYAQIINVDSENCATRSYIQINSTESFYYCTCYRNNCDDKNTKLNMPKSGFKCEYLNKANIKNVIQSVQNVTEKDKWICFVNINFFGEGSQIEAGHLEINSPFMKHCIEEGVYEPDFCCVNIVNTDQSKTDCTVAKQLRQFKDGIKNPSENSIKTHGTDLEHIHCYSKDISNSESEHCPKSDGCFSTRILRPSEITSTNAFEPAGCLGYAEKYTVENLPLTSLSLGCRVDENSNRCSIVQTPEGEQRIVCCCNENDQNGLCNTNLNKVPQKIGKNISSFKSLH